MEKNYNDELDELFNEESEVKRVRDDDNWSIQDLSTALWADGIIYEREQRVDEIERVYEERKEKLLSKLDQWKNESLKPLYNDIDFFKDHLHVWHLKILEEEKKKGIKKLSKTIKLQHRDLTCRSQQPQVLINGKDVVDAKDDPDFVAYVKENSPEYIKEEVSWGDYKKTLKRIEVDGKLFYVDENGQPVEFIKLIPQSDKFDWKRK